MKPRVAVLLAGYAGEKFIFEQVFSIFNQVEVDVEIFLRVDGDSLEFDSVLRKLASRVSQVHYIKGDIISSPSSNFYKLISYDFPSHYHFYALSDQDDIWGEHKLSDSISYFNGDQPQAVSSGVNAFFQDGSIVSQRLGRQTELDFFFQSGGAGCTYVLNDQGFHFLRSCLRRNPELTEVSSHDWLIYFLFRVNNLRWHFTSANLTYYRQHSNNVAGLNRGFSAKVRRLIALFFGWYCKDLCILIRYAKVNNMFPLMKNPLVLRRSLVGSVVIWLYYWFWIHRRI